MIRQSLVDVALNRLLEHFGSSMIVRPPATAEELAALEYIVGPLPRELTIFLSTCNGLRIDTAHAEPDLHIWNTHEMLSSIVSAPGPDVPQGFIAFSGDPLGERDWIIVGHGPVENAVVRWDPWVPGVELMATCFGTYLDGWTYYVTDWFDGHGLPMLPIGERPSFDPHFMEEHDEELTKLAADAAVCEWLEKISRAVKTGEDFE
ncbi:MAG: SMI1/KNR4 family protein [Planctomycetota bacterium]|jgi:hypothetical protein